MAAPLSPAASVEGASGVPVAGTAPASSLRALAARGLQNTRTALGKPTVQSWLWYGGLPLLAFIILSPGMVLTLPPAADCKGVKRAWFSYQTSIGAVLLHSLLFFGLLVAIFWGGSSLGIALPLSKAAVKKGV